VQGVSDAGKIQAMMQEGKNAFKPVLEWFLFKERYRQVYLP